MSRLLADLVEPFRLGLLQRALAEVVLVGLLAAVVGCFVVLRGLSFAGESLSHTVLPGVAIAYAAGASIYLGAGLFALLTILLVLGVGRASQASADTAIGVAFAGLFPLGVILLATQTTPSRSLDELLFGDPLAIDRSDLLITAVVSAAVAIAGVGAFRALVATSFDRAFAEALGYPAALVDAGLLVAVAATVVLALLTVGNVLSLGLLVTPAAAARLLARRLVPTLVWAAVLAVIAGVVALELSYWIGVAAGPCIVLCTTAELAGAGAVRALRGRRAGAREGVGTLLQLAP